MGSMNPDLVMGTLMPAWYMVHNEVVNEVWPRLWRELVDELAPDTLKEGFKRGMHPKLVEIVRTFLASGCDATVK